ncbi:uncharacterized protein LOC101900387 isoform X2 [Musca domestica]|uniref:Uncharacterized protein LOC101900387 isoform X2 n=1 Tax=Musca domestica TaxID=7370 RepID=A0A1I8M7U6_MUSDO|nr:uncharacterized protein LOC101900387 isoform X2 [Musca domestica]
MEIEIKEEPLDDCENAQEIFNKQQCQEEEAAVTSLLKQQLQMAFIKDEPLDDSDIFTVVEEHDQFITVSAADMKTQDELQFIKKLHEPKRTKFSGSCPKCLKEFNKRSSYSEHIKRNNCIVKRKCSACPLTFVEPQSLLKHLTLHRDNKFFCSQNCGANFDTLPLCEDHEKRIHKITNPPKIRYKHFCSYCREGFKTELQLHVHWLQKDVNCGKLLHAVATHYSMTSDMINNTEKLANETDNKKSLPPAPTFAVTKLRLKSNMPPPLTAIKRPNEMVVKETEAKRSKCVSNLKTILHHKPNEMLTDLLANIEVKKESMDEEEDVLNTTPLMPEVIIKTEDENQTDIQYKTADKKPGGDVLSKNKELKSLFINDSKEMNPEFHGKIIQMTAPSKVSHVPALQKTNNNNKQNINNDQIKNSLNIVANDVNNNSNSNLNNSLKNITNLKLLRLAPTPMAPSNIILPPNIQLIPLQKPGQQQTIGEIMSAPKMTLQILKLMPASHLPNHANNNILFQQPLNVVKIANTPLVMSQPMPQKQIPTMMQSQSNLNSLTPISTKPIETQNPSTVGNNQSSISVNGNTTQNREERIQYIPKKKLIAIESMPEKKHIIDTMKQQIAKVAVGDTSLTGNETKQTKPLMNISKDVESSIKVPGCPPTLYLPILSTIDVELVEARYKYPDYKYKWICPYCLKDYDIKRCLKSHLTKAHHLTSRDMDKINVQAKAFKNEDVATDAEKQQKEAYGQEQTKIKQESKQISIDLPSSDGGSTIPNDLDNSSTTPPPQPIKMSALNIVKPRYICEKCGRKCSSKTMLNDHISANCSREPQYPCQQCPKKFYSLSTLQCHMTIHTGDLPHKCNYCDKRFRTRGQVTVHHRTHTGERPFVCQVGMFPALHTP